MYHSATSIGELSEATLPPLVDVVTRGRKIVEVVTKDPLKVVAVHPILEVDLPALEGDSLTLADFCAITVEETDAFEEFHDFLRLKFLELDSAVGDEQIDRRLLQIGTELRQGIRKVEDELNRIRRRRAVAATGAAVATTSATLVAVFPQHLATVLTALGVSGAFNLLYGEAVKYIGKRPTPAQRPCYYLWLLEQRKGR